MPQAINKTDADVSAILGEKFLIIKELTKTDARCIYLAHDLRHLEGGNADAARLVRLKVLPRSLAGDRRQKELFYLEASAAARLSHPNIVKSELAEEVNGVHFCVIEQRPDVITLSDYLKGNGWLNADEAVRICWQIADAFEYAHRQGVLHLTLKPEDVLLHGEGEVLITGFGIERAKELAWARQERSHQCEARYISPEQVIAADVDQRSDLYLIGLLFFEMLTDRAPFESGDETSLKLKHLTRDPGPPQIYRQELSGPLSQTVMDMLAKRPDGRPFCASTLKSALERCVKSGLIADEEIEGDEGLAQSDDFAHPRLMVADVAPDWVRPPEEDQESSNAPAMHDGEMADPEADETETADRADDLDNVFQNPSHSYQPNLMDDSYVASSSEAEDERVAAGDTTQMDGLEGAPSEADEYESRDSLNLPHGLRSEESSNVRFRRLAWLAVLLLVGAAAFWGTRADRFDGKKLESASPGPVAQPQSNSESAALSEEIAVPTPELTVPTEERGSSSASEPITSAMGGVPSDSGKAHDAAMQKKQAEETTAEKPVVPGRSSAAPPPLPTLKPDFPATDNPLAESYGKTLSDTQPREPAPVPEQPVKEEATASKVIRKSGDVLQNTAIVRPKPVYPKAARAAGIKGAVSVEVTIDEEGGVVTARPISGPEQLRDAAVAAARGWKWVPEKVNRKRVRVAGAITFTFRD